MRTAMKGQRSLLWSRHISIRTLEAQSQRSARMGGGGRAVKWNWLEDCDFEHQHCSRDKLETDVVHYVSKEQRRNYAVQIEDGVLRRRGELVNTGTAGWIFVMKDNTLYANPKITTQIPR